jgi:hypothetical protein
MPLHSAQHTIEIANGVATKAIVGGATAALYGGFTATEIAAFGGLLIAFLGLIAKIYFDYQLLQLAKLQISEDKLEELARKGKLDRRSKPR